MQIRPTNGLKVLFLNYFVNKRRTIYKTTYLYSCNFNKTKIVIKLTYLNKYIIIKHYAVT